MGAVCAGPHLLVVPDLVEIEHGPERPPRRVTHSFEQIPTYGSRDWSLRGRGRHAML